VIGSLAHAANEVQLVGKAPLTTVIIMIRQALILAAGMGTRIRNGANDVPKPLHTVLGQSLLRRTILSLADAGITRIGVVIGFRGELIAAAIASEAEFQSRGLDIFVIDNQDYEKANGVSVLAGKPHFDEPFLLTMADHIFDSALAQRAAEADMSKADLYLCVDYRLPEVYDMEDCTKVSTVDGDCIGSISKELTDYNCVDCGVFAVAPALFDELSLVFETHGDCSLSNGVGALASKRRARVLDIGDCFWQDVDTQPARERAESILAVTEKTPISATGKATAHKPVAQRDVAVSRR